MEWIVSLVALGAILILVGRGLPGRSRLLAVAATLAFVLVVVLLERSGWWPQGWQVR